MNLSQNPLVPELRLEISELEKRIKRMQITIDQLSLELKECKRENRELRSETVGRQREFNELEGVLLDCLNEVKKDVYRRRE